MNSPQSLRFAPFNKSIVGRIVLVVLTIPFLFAVGRLPKMDLNLDYKSLVGTSFDIKAQEGPITYRDVKHFLPTVELEPAAPNLLKMNFEVKEDRPFRRDPVIGSFTIHIERGSTSPSKILTSNDSPDVEIPPGAPDVTTGSFWLGCTNANRIKGNVGKDNDSQAMMYVQHTFGFVQGYRLIGTRSPNHLVRCVSPGSGSDGGSDGGSTGLECESMADCPRGNCAGEDATSHYECVNGKCRCLAD